MVEIPPLPLGTMNVNNEDVDVMTDTLIFPLTRIILSFVDGAKLYPVNVMTSPCSAAVYRVDKMRKRRLQLSCRAINSLEELSQSWDSKNTRKEDYVRVSSLRFSQQQQQKQKPYWIHLRVVNRLEFFFIPNSLNNKRWLVSQPNHPQ